MKRKARTGKLTTEKRTRLSERDHARPCERGRTALAYAPPTRRDRARQVRWSDLSIELLVRMFECLAREELRAVRLVNKVARDLATPLLFSRVHLSPSLNSLRRLSKIGERPQLARLVRTLECHSCGLGEYFVDLDIHERSLLDHFSWLSPVSLPDALSDFEYNLLRFRLYSAYLDEVAAQRNWAPADVGNALQTTLAPFEQLQGVVWDNCEDDGVQLPRHSALFRRTGVRNLDHITRMGFLESCHGLQCHRVTSFTAFQVRWTDFESQRTQLPVVESIFRSVQTLHLEFETADLLEATLDQETVGAFGRLMGQAREVRDLRIGFDNPPSFDTLHPVGRVWPCFVGGHHPLLQRVRLDRVVVSEDALVGFVEAHRDGLVSLTLSGTELKPNTYIRMNG